MAGIGGLMCDHKGKVILAFTKRLSGSTSPEHVKTADILESLCFVDHFFTIQTSLWKRVQNCC